jgi:glutathione S-transferase
MKLFTFATSPYARKVRMALELKGVGFEPIERCYSYDRIEDLRAFSRRAEVPALVLDDGRTITDSTIICEFIEETYPSPALYPTDPFERARMRMIEDLCDTSFDATAFGFWIAMLRDDAPEALRMRQSAGEEFRGLLGHLEQELGSADFFCGALSIADLTAICHVPGARAMGVRLDAFPKLQAWMERMQAIPVVQADHERLMAAIRQVPILEELEGPDGRVHWRDSRLQWPLRHGFLDLIVREYRAGKMMFPPNAA